MVNRQNALLEQLRIEREEQGASRSGRFYLGLSAAALVLAVSVAGAWLWLAPPPIEAVRVARAEPVHLEPAASRQSVLDASGYVVARRQATVSSKVTGRVVEVLIEEGQHVEEGEIIARLDDVELRANLAQAEAQRAHALASLNALQVQLENARMVFERHRRQFTAEIISAQDFDLAKADFDTARTNVEVAERALAVAEANVAVAQRNLEDAVVRAPFAGIVTVKAAQEGEIVSPVSAGGGFTRTGIGTIVDMSSLEVEVDVSENFIHRVRVDQEAKITLNAYPEWTIPGRVLAIIPTADRAKATVRVRVGFDESDERILPEMGARVSLLGAAGDAPAAASPPTAVIVPREAVHSESGTHVVFVISGDRLERRPVRLGAAVSEGQVVLSGLAVGARVAVNGASSLTDGARVRVVNEG